MRHGKTDWNNKYKLQGRTDVPLNNEGINSGKLAHDEYIDVPFDICFCSPLARAKQTAELLLEGRNIPIIYDDRLVEMSFGIYEGQERIFEQENNDIINLFKKPEKYVIPVENGESFTDLFERVSSFLNDSVEPLLKEGKNVLIVGHGALNSAIVTIVKQLEIKDFWSYGIPNCKLIKL
ncbi:MAG: histidine phosphatase family protein [Bacilli bacterium]|nr:histidine phosphatase family protein [Bacilli bacterium]